MVIMEWPFNPNFPHAFSFPAFGTAEWLALSWWDDCKGDASKVPGGDRLKAGAKLNWREIWWFIYYRNHMAVDCRFIRRISFADSHAAQSMGVGGWQGTPTKTSVISFPETKHYSVTQPAKWIETLLEADEFWWYDINAWALECVKDEFEILKPGGAPLTAYSLGADPDGTSANQCEHFCRRFCAYQQARYRWHEHLLEKNCERALGKYAPGTPKGYIPQTAKEVRACLIGWLSKQRGCAKNPLVKEMRRQCRAKKSILSSGEKNAFQAERTYPSNRRYRISLSSPSRPDEMGWLILTWPIWNFYDWKWVHLAEAVKIKFGLVDAKGKPLDFLKTSRQRLQKALCANLDDKHSMPAENALALMWKYLVTNPSPKEKQMHKEWGRRSRRENKIVEQLCRIAAGWLPILERPKGRGMDAKPPLWDFAYRLSV